MPPFGHYPAVIKAVVLDHIRAHGDDGSLTARVVREETERRAGLAAGSLKEHKEEIMKVIEEVLGEQPKAPAPDSAGAASAAGAGGISGTSSSSTDTQLVGEGTGSGGCADDCFGAKRQKTVPASC